MTGIEERDELLLGLIDVIAPQSNCCARKLGAVAMRDGDIVTFGVNGTLPHMTRCDQGGCARCANSTQMGGSIQPGADLERCLCLHAEQKLVVTAAKFGHSLQDTVVGIHTQPCTSCMKLLIAAGVREVVFRDPYPAGWLVNIVGIGHSFHIRRFSERLINQKEF